MIKCANHKWARDVDAFIRPPVCVCVCVSWNIRGIFFQTSSHLTLHVCWSCPVQFITGVNVTFILAMTIMYFSTCHSQVRIIPCVICFVLHVLPSPGTYRCASELQANSTLKRTWTGDSFIKPWNALVSRSLFNMRLWTNYFCIIIFSDIFIACIM